MPPLADDPCCRVYDRYKYLLLLRSDYPLSPIYSTKNLAKKTSRDQERNDKVNMVGDEFETAALGSILINIKSFGILYRKLLDEVKFLQQDLFGGIDFEDEDWFSFEVPDIILDLVNSREPGYFFGADGRNKLGKYEGLGLKALMHHPRLRGRYGHMVSRDQFIPNAVACQDFLQRASVARSKIAVATHISVGGPARGTEFSAQCLRNHPQGDIRHLKIIDGSICLVSGYNKTSSMVSPPPEPLLTLAITHVFSRRKGITKYTGSSPRASTEPASSTG